MAVGDDSVFSTADEALWAAFAAAGTRATSLVTWRKEQSPSGLSAGRNYSTGEVPRIEDIAANDCPAIVITDRGALAPDDVGADFEQFSYPKAILGLLWKSRDEVATSKKVKRFAHLVHAVLVEQRAACFSSLVTATPNPIRQFEIGAIEFPQFEQTDSVAAFGMTVTFLLDLPVN